MCSRPPALTRPSGLSAWWSELKMIGIFAFYLGCNFVVIVIPAVAYAAWLGDAVSRGLLALALVDYAVPLRPGRPWVAWCELTRVAQGIQSYFDAECVIEGNFRRDRSHLIVSHPHGLFGAGYGLYAHELRERFGMKPLFTGADVVFMLPLLRRIMVWWGMTMVSAAPLRRALSQPWPYNAVQLQPGGIAEMFYGTDCEQIILSKRKGLCRVALQTGASLVPSYVFGANEIYTRWFGPHSLAARLSSVLRTSLVGWCRERSRRRTTRWTRCTQGTSARCATSSSATRAGWAPSGSPPGGASCSRTRRPARRSRATVTRRRAPRSSEGRGGQSGELRELEAGRGAALPPCVAPGRWVDFARGTRLSSRSPSDDPRARPNQQSNTLRLYS